MDEAASSATDILLIFKSGNNPLVGYLVGGADSGTWDNPYTGDVFDFPGNSQEQALSHLSVYYRGGTQVVPTPAAVLPGLLGMSIAAFRKKNRGQEKTRES